MLPIDEHAKSGLLVYVRVRFDKSLHPTRYDPDSDTFDSPYGDFWPPEELDAYLPASWVEQAGAMREALKEVDRAIYSDDYANAALLTDFNQVLVDSVLAATEWPPKQEAK